MDVRIASFNADFQEEVYMTQFEGFKVKGKENMVHGLKKKVKKSNFSSMVLKI